MAKVTINADTQTGDMECHIDGKAMESVVGCSLYASERWDADAQKYMPAVGMEMRMKPVKDNGVVYNMTAYASNHEKAVAAINRKTAEFLTEDIVLIPDTSVISADFAKALRQ